MTDVFVALGGQLTELPAEVVARAVAANPWFTERDVRRAARAIAERMLDGDKLREWLGRYTPPAISADTPGERSCEESSFDKCIFRDLSFDGRIPESGFPGAYSLVGGSPGRKRVGVVMAGNIPLVGFFDMLCVLAAGYECRYKPSSKDAVLMDWVAEQLAVSLPVRRWDCGRVDALIATGSDNTRRLFEGRFAGLPTLLRGSRGSVAVLDGGESDEELRALADDIFSCSGLGCRSVSRLFLPAGYDIERLAEILNEHGAPSEGYRNNFLQRRAVLAMQGAKYTEGDFFLLREADGFPDYISEIRYGFGDAEQWLAAHRDEVQCVVGRDVPFGEAQLPGLTDYADGIDIMKFLMGL